MCSFRGLIELLLTLSVVISLVSNYLRVNKVWSRRAVREVTESISISAALLGLSTAVPFFIYFTFVESDAAPAIRTAVSIGTGAVFVLIASGIWVSEYRGRGFWRLVMGALRLEGSESADLLKALDQPTGARELIRVFEAMARVDKHVDIREIEMIERFAHRWRVEAPRLNEGHVTEGGSVMELRSAVERYLEISPPVEQAEELLDVLHMFVQADARVSSEEELVLEEVTGLITRYVGGVGADDEMFEVVIVPQSDPQIDAVRELLPGVDPKTARGGTVFSAGRFFSRRYADVVCEKYVALGLFTARVDA